MSLSGKKWKKMKKFQKSKSCRQLPQHRIHTVFKIFHIENQDNQILVLQLLCIISCSNWSVSKFPLSMLILGQKACFLGPTIFEIPKPNWHHCLLISLCLSDWLLDSPNRLSLPRQLSAVENSKRGFAPQNAHGDCSFFSLPLAITASS